MPQYQGVWTLEQQAQAQSNQQWVTDPNFKNTTLLLQADGTGSGSQNNTFLDGSTNNFFITRNGNTTQGSFSPFSQAPGYWSNYFDGSGDYISMPSATSALALGSGDWTVECFAYITDFSDNRTLIDIYDGNSSVRFIWRIKTTGLLAFQGSNGTDRTVTTTTVPTNTWVHLAICKASGTTRMFINGIQSNTNYTDTNTYTNSGASAIGIISSDFSSSPYLGYISNFRVVKGTALYAANFNPPTSTLTAVTNTSLLTCQSNRFVDNSTSALALTIGGNVSVQAFGPFAPALQWTPDVVGGSGYFDGSGDYLSISSVSSFNLGTNDFTLEVWWYPTAFSADGEIFHCYNGAFSFYNSSTGGQVDGYIGTGAGSWNIMNIGNIGVAKLNSWNHIAITRSGSTFRTFLNGVAGATATSSSSITTTNCFVGARTGGAGVVGSCYITNCRVLSGTALYTSAFTPPTAPLTAVSGTTFLLSCTNAGIYDGKMANNLETVGNAQVSTSVVKYGSGSMYFDGTGDYLIFKTSPLYAFGTGDFTIEAWMNPTTLSSSTNSGLIGINSSGGYAWLVNVLTDRINVFTTGTTTNTFLTPVQTNVWQHLAITRANGLLRCFLNGTQAGSAIALTSNLTSLVPLHIGANLDGGPSQYFTGYIDDVRITNGVARYISNFTPPQQALPRQ